MHLHDLPDDILTIIFALLSPKSFLALCRSSKTFYAYRQHPAFWRTETASTFRTPISPLLRADGARWYWLYKRLRTQTQLFTWGQGIKGDLGPGRALPPPRAFRGPRGLRFRGHGPVRIPFVRVNSYWPTEAHVPPEVGVIADLQCGGWSTTILSSTGKLYTTGILNATNGNLVGRRSSAFEQLEYLTQSQSNIAQFSAGRAHVLALTDANEILSWDRINTRGLKVLSRHGERFTGTPTRVVAGWGQSSAYIPEIGLIYWTPLVNNEQPDELDAREIGEKIVPGTATTSLQDRSIVQVTAHVVLEGYLVFLIGGELWACGIGNENYEDLEPKAPAFPVPGYQNNQDQMEDVQGSFRSFAVFSSAGRVLAGDTDYLRRCAQSDRQHGIHNLPNDLPNSPTYRDWPDLEGLLSTRPRDIPALQKTGVIAVTFGDYHFQALHSNGKITSFGTQSDSCGTLGLGEFRPANDGPNGSAMRGVVAHRGRDSQLLPIAELKGREIWFEHEKRDWLNKLAKDSNAADLSDPERLTVLSQWVEQYGRQWSEGPDLGTGNAHDDPQQLQRPEENDFHLDPYFALAIGAAGWHSGALVLVDEELAETTRQKWLVQPKQHPADEVHADGDTEVNPSHKMPGHFDTTGDMHKEETEETYVWDAQDEPLAFEAPEGWTGQSFDSSASAGDVQVTRRPWRRKKPSIAELGLPFPET